MRIAVAVTLRCLGSTETRRLPDIGGGRPAVINSRSGGRGPCRVEYPQLEDPQGRTRAGFGWHSGLPITVFVDADGTMVATERTSFRTYAEVTAAVERHLGVSLPRGNS